MINTPTLSGEPGQAHAPNLGHPFGLDPPKSTSEMWSPRGPACGAPVDKVSCLEVEWEVRKSAHDHGVADDDMIHAIRNAWVTLEQEAGTTMFLGPSTDGRPLEVGVYFESDETPPRIIHAMKMRPKFQPYLASKPKRR